ncbi:MAG: hypothetical protein HFJ08_04935 [Lachnospiraceae bacterium]|nr:hypothetical protein [Lachnospiraceae bacterium]
MSKVYIVHCVDTEGPLYETLDATFNRVKQIFGVDIKPSEENLKKLQNGEFELGGREKEVARMLDNSLIYTYKNFSEIESMITRLNKKEFRDKLIDSNGEGWKCSWFCMDHVGFLGENPRMRISGYHSIYDWYMQKVKYSYGDIIQWHYHPISINGDYNACGMNYVSSNNVFEVLARKIIDRKFFPTVYRPGFHTERPDSHWLLEQWIPFDYANQATVEKERVKQRDMENGRFGNWEGATTSWKPYHPDFEDYRKEGKCRRIITRCLNMNTRMRNIKEDDFEQAFYEAQNGKSQIISFTDHDFRDICYDINLMREMLLKVSNRYPSVQFEFCNALQAMRKYFGFEINSCNLRVELQVEYRKLLIEADKNIFGVQPFFCLKLLGSRYIWSNLDFVGDYRWSFTFDRDSVVLDSVEKIGIAANSLSGVTDVVIVDVKTKKIEKRILNN